MEDINIEKLSSVSQLLGNDMDMEKLGSMMQTAKMLSTMMNTSSVGKLKEVKEVSAQEETVIHKEEASKDRQIKALNAVIPLLDTQYQMGMFMALKMLEINSFRPEPTIRAMGSEFDTKDRRVEVIDAVDKFLTAEERKKIGVFLKLVKANFLIS